MVKLRWSVLALLAPMAVACDEAPTTPGRDGGDAAIAGDSAVDSSTGEGGAQPDGSVGVNDLVSITLAPATSELVVRTGAARTAQFVVNGTRRDGVPVTRVTGVTWTLDSTRAGSIDGTGLFTANGEVAGVVTVRAEVASAGGALTAMAMLTVRIASTHTDGAIDPGLLAEIDGLPTGMTAAPAISYPLDRAVMPQNVRAPEVHWQPSGVMNDVFRVRLSKPSVTVTAYVLHRGPSFGHRWAVDAMSWKALLDSDPTSPLTIRVDRVENGARRYTQASTVTVELARGAIAGTIYYWNVDRGRIMKISPATGRATELTPRWSAGGETHCIACHSVSRNGRYLAVSVENDVLGAVLDLTAAETPPTFARAENRRFSFSTFNPDATRMIVNWITPPPAGMTAWSDPRRFALLDPATGAQIAATGLPNANVSQPEWSPDGRSVAMVTNVSSSFNRADAYESGDLGVMSAMAGDQFGPVQTLHSGPSLAGAPEGGSADEHPSWTPNSQWIAFAHGEFGRATAGGGGGATTEFPGALYMIARAGGAAVRLDRANDGPSGNRSYWPTFSPFESAAAEGAARYYWLAYFTSRRYGNTAQRRQLWVTAVDTMPAAGRDPSHVPYWLPGQDASTDNAAAYWTAESCRPNGERCTAGSECCSERCMSPGGGQPSVCVPPPPEACRGEGATCGAGGDCCRGLSCVANVCLAVPG